MAESTTIQIVVEAVMLKYREHKRKSEEPYLFNRFYDCRRDGGCKYWYCRFFDAYVCEYRFCVHLCGRDRCQNIDDRGVCTATGRELRADYNIQGTSVNAAVVFTVSRRDELGQVIESTLQLFVNKESHGLYQRRREAHYKKAIKPLRVQTMTLLDFVLVAGTRCRANCPQPFYLYGSRLRALKKQLVAIYTELFPRGRAHPMYIIIALMSEFMYSGWEWGGRTVFPASPLLVNMPTVKELNRLSWCHNTKVTAATRQIKTILCERLAANHSYAIR